LFLLSWRFVMHFIFDILKINKIIVLFMQTQVIYQQNIEILSNCTNKYC
jgi:hypothetical protein